jgi:hypothetical protein
VCVCVCEHSVYNGFGDHNIYFLFIVFVLFFFVSFFVLSYSIMRGTQFISYHETLKIHQYLNSEALRIIGMVWITSD